MGNGQVVSACVGIAGKFRHSRESGNPATLAIGISAWAKAPWIPPERVEGFRGNDGILQPNTDTRWEYQQPEAFAPVSRCGI